MKIWALPEFCKVNPITRGILEDDPSRYGNEPSTRSDRRNSVWDGAASAVSLVAARNETAAFQVMVDRNCLIRHSLTIDFKSPFPDPEGRMKGWREWYIPMNGQWYPDGLLPIRSGEPMDLNRPDNGVDGQAFQGFFFDLFVPAAIKPGAYSTAIRIRSGKAVLSVMTLRVTVLPLTLPVRPSFTMELNSYGGYHGSYRPRDIQDAIRHIATPEYERQRLLYHRLAREHYGVLNSLLYRQNGETSPSVQPRLDSHYLISDFGPWDRKFGPYLDGSAFTEGYGRGEPVSDLYLPFNITWPAPYHFFPSDYYRNIITENIRRFDRHLREKGWTRTRFHLMLNHKSRRSPYPFNLDEPTRIRDYGMLRYYADAVNAGKRKNSPIKLRLDVGHYECTHVMDEVDQAPFETRCTHSSVLNGCSDFWVTSIGHASAASFLKRKRKGETVWVYQGSSWINRPLTDMAQILLKARALHASGYCAWHAHGWKDDPWKGTDDHFGFDHLFYPGEPMGFEGPLPSLRLKACRRALMDLDYLEVLRGYGRAALADALLRGMTKSFDPIRFSMMDELKSAEMRKRLLPSGAYDDFRSRLAGAFTRSR